MEIQPGGKSIIRSKAFSLLPMRQDEVAPNVSPAPRPTDHAMLRAYGENPWLHIKLVRQCSTIAGLEFTVQARNPKTGQLGPLAYDYPLWRLLRRPNPIMRGWDFRFLSELYVRVTGEVFWQVMRGGFAPLWLYVWPRQWVQPVYERGQIVRYVVQAQLSGYFTTRMDVAPKDMLWLRVPDPVNPYVQGLGDVLSLATEVDTYELASESDRRFFKRDAQPGGALVLPGMPTREQRNAIMDDWKRAVNPDGVADGASVPILAGGMDYKQFRQGRREMDFIEGQRMLRDFILSGVHKHIVGISDDVTFANAKAADYTFAQWDIMPRVRWWTDNLNEQLAPLFDERATVVFANPVPQDETFELEKATRGVQIGTVKRNEWRERNGYPPLPDEEGDVYILPVTMIEVPADRTGERMDAQTQRPDQTPHQNPNPNEERPTPANEQAPPGSDDGKAETQARPKAVSATARKQLNPDLIRQIIGNLDEESREVMRRMEAALMEVFRGRYVDVAQELGMDFIPDLVDLRAIRYIVEGAYPRIVGATQETFDRIHAQLVEGTAEGEDIHRLQERVTSVFQEAKGFRAHRIARQETMFAANAAALNAYQQSGAVEKVEWLLAPDYDPKDDDGECAELDGAVANIGEPFAGTSVTHPPLHIMCRCAIAPIIAEQAPPQEVEPSTAEPAGAVVDYTEYNPTSYTPMPLTADERRLIRREYGGIVDRLHRYKTMERRAEIAIQGAAEKVWPRLQRWISRENQFSTYPAPWNNLAGAGFRKFTPLEGGDASYGAYMAWSSARLELNSAHKAAFGRVLSARRIETAHDGFVYGVAWHELAHALMDGGVMSGAMYRTVEGSSAIEAFNTLLGQRIAVTVADAAGQELTREAVIGMVTTTKYAVTTLNWVRLMETELGLNMADERVLSRALRAIYAAPKPADPLSVAEVIARALHAEFQAELVAAGVTAEQFSAAAQFVMSHGFKNLAPVEKVRALLGKVR